MKTNKVIIENNRTYGIEQVNSEIIATVGDSELRIGYNNVDYDNCTNDEFDLGLHVNNDDVAYYVFGDRKKLETALKGVLNLVKVYQGDITILVQLCAKMLFLEADRVYQINPDWLPDVEEE